MNIDITISYSRVATYLACPQEHYFSYVEGLKPKAVVRPLSFGRAFHRLLQYRNDPEKLAQTRDLIEDEYYDLPDDQQVALGEDFPRDVAEIFEDYCKVWEGSEQPVETEHEFKIPIARYKGNTVYFHGIIDEIYADGSIGEHKTFKVKPDLSILAMNQQSMLYAKALELERGIKPRKIRWDYIKSIPAERPMWLAKSARFSEAKSSKITPYSWLRACKEMGIDNPEILAKASRYEANIPNFFFRHEIDVIPEMVDMVWEDFKYTVKEILLRGNANKVKRISRDCSWCSFRPLCYAQFTGADVEYVKQTDYTQRER